MGKADAHRCALPANHFALHGNVRILADASAFATLDPAQSFAYNLFRALVPESCKVALGLVVQHANEPTKTPAGAESGIPWQIPN